MFSFEVLQIHSYVQYFIFHGTNQQYTVLCNPLLDMFFCNAMMSIYVRFNIRHKNVHKKWFLGFYPFAQTISDLVFYLGYERIHLASRLSCQMLCQVLAGHLVSQR